MLCLKFLRNIPNILTTLRGIAGPIVPILFFCVSPIAALITFLAAAATDLFDGSLARIIPNAESKYGKTMDPVFDKILGFFGLGTAICAFPFMAIPLILEALIAGVNVTNYFKTKKIESSKLGKIKTVVLFATICLSFIPGISPIAIAATLGVSTFLQIVTLKGYAEDLKNSKKEEIKKIIIGEKQVLEQYPDKEEQESLKLKLQKKTRKEKYLDLQRIARNIVTGKEAFERSISEKIVARQLKK